jgi:hypothetical protein
MPPRPDTPSASRPVPAHEACRETFVESSSELERLAALVEVLLASRDAERADHRRRVAALSAEVRRLSGMLDMVMIGIGSIAKP